MSHSVTQWTAACQASLSITNCRSLRKLMSIKLVMPPNHLILCRHLLLAAFNISQHQGLFQWVNYLHQVAKYWRFSFSISPSNKYSGQISFRIGWFDLLAVQGTLNSLLTTPQFQSINSSALNFIVQLSHPYMMEKP